MNADPDFYPLASAWLEGAATPPEQQLLSEILQSSDIMREYAALCRTEALLLQAGRKPVVRRTALQVMLRGKPWPRRIAGIWQNHTFRWSAAAAIVATAAWMLWPDNSATPDDTVKRQRTPLIATQPSPGNARDNDAIEPLPPAEKGLEEKLRRYWVQDFGAVGPLEDVAAKLVRSVHLKDGPALAADVRGKSDAPAHLQPLCPLPAWTLLQMAAAQTGTEVKLSGSSAVFRPARKPVSFSGTAQRTTDVHVLGALFSTNTPLHDYTAASALATEAFGSGVAFVAPPPSNSVLSGLDPTVPYSGTPRDVRVMELALEAASRRPPEVEFATHAIVIPAGTTSQQLLAQLGINLPGAGTSVLTAEQMEIILNDPAVAVNSTLANSVRLQSQVRSLISFSAAGESVAVKTLKREIEEQLSLKASLLKSGFGERHPKVQSLTVSLDQMNRQLDATTLIPGQFVEASLTAARRGKQGVDLSVAMSFEQPAPEETIPGFNKQELATKVTLDSGSTLYMAGSFSLTDGRELVLFVTPTLLDINNPPPASEISVEVQGMGGAGAEELPYGIPVPGKAGMVQSPYAPDKGFIDVGGYKRGTRVECPYSRKHFRVP